MGYAETSQRMKGETTAHGSHWLIVIRQASSHANAPLMTCCALINPVKTAQPRMITGT
jgi:hypothetical protein